MSIRGFDSWEEMESWMHDKEQQANERVSKLQSTIAPGDYVARPYKVGDRFCLIVARTMTLDELLDLERSAGAGRDELAYTRKRMFEVFARGYRTAEWYSVLEPQGEYGDAHISTMMPITRSEFEHYLALIQAGQEPIGVWITDHYNKEQDDPQEPPEA